MFTLDTNIIISYLNDEKPVVERLLQWKERKESFIVSVITEIETLSYPELTAEEITIIERLFKEFTVIPVDSQIGKITADFRRKLKLSLGDSVIVATAYITGSHLVTLDREIISKAKNTVSIITIEKG